MEKWNLNNHKFPEVSIFFKFIEAELIYNVFLIFAV